MSNLGVGELVNVTRDLYVEGKSLRLATMFKRGVKHLQFLVS